RGWPVRLAPADEISANQPTTHSIGRDTRRYWIRKPGAARINGRAKLWRTRETVDHAALERRPRRPARPPHVRLRSAAGQPAGRPPRTSALGLRPTGLRRGSRAPLPERVRDP